MQKPFAASPSGRTDFPSFCGSDLLGRDPSPSAGGWTRPDCGTAGSDPSQGETAGARPLPAPKNSSRPSSGASRANASRSRVLGAEHPDQRAGETGMAFQRGHAARRRGSRPAHHQFSKCTFSFAGFHGRMGDADLDFGVLDKPAWQPMFRSLPPEIREEKQHISCSLRRHPLCEPCWPSGERGPLSSFTFHTSEPRGLVLQGLHSHSGAGEEVPAYTQAHTYTQLTCLLCQLQNPGSSYPFHRAFLPISDCSSP